MSRDPSPWGEMDGPFPEEEPPPTAELLKEYEKQKEDEETPEMRARLWNTYAKRLKADGTLMR